MPRTAAGRPAPWRTGPDDRTRVGPANQSWRLSVVESTTRVLVRQGPESLRIFLLHALTERWRQFRHRFQLDAVGVPDDVAGLPRHFHPPGPGGEISRGESGRHVRAREVLQIGQLRTRHTGLAHGLGPAGWIDAVVGEPDSFAMEVPGEPQSVVAPVSWRNASGPRATRRIEHDRVRGAAEQVGRDGVRLATVGIDE